MTAATPSESERWSSSLWKLELSVSKRSEKSYYSPQSPWSKNTQCVSSLSSFGAAWMRADLRRGCSDVTDRRDILVHSSRTKCASVLLSPDQMFGWVLWAVGDGPDENQAEGPAFTTAWSKNSRFPLKYLDAVVKWSALQRACSSFWMHRNKHRCL